MELALILSPIFPTPLPTHPRHRFLSKTPDSTGARIRCIKKAAGSHAAAAAAAAVDRQGAVSARHYVFTPP